MEHLRFPEDPLYYRDKLELPASIRTDVILICELKGSVNLNLMKSELLIYMS